MTDDGMTALFLAARNGHLEIVRMLVEQGGAAVDAAMTDHGFTALMLASAAGELETVRLLLLLGANKLLLCHGGATAHDLAAAHPLVQAELA